jgi:hypothetical protein
MNKPVFSPSGYTQNKQQPMRAKAILLSAAVIAAGIATSAAQSVYSVNAVGYVNLTMKSGYNLIGNPLNSTNNNHINAVLPDAPDFSALLTWNLAAQQFNQADLCFSGVWYDLANQPSQTRLDPGKAFFFQNQSGGDVIITFVGEVPQGSLTNFIGANFGFYASQVPQAGTLSALGFPGLDFMSFYKWNPVLQRFEPAYNYIIQWYDPDNNPSDPSLGVAEGFLLSNPNPPVSWTRNFSVNNN